LTLTARHALTELDIEAEPPRIVVSEARTRPDLVEDAPKPPRHLTAATRDNGGPRTGRIRRGRADSRTAARGTGESAPRGRCA